MYLKFFIAAPAVILYLFLYWKYLKDDYPQQSIFSSAFYILFGIAIFYMISFYYRESWWFWFSGAGALIGYLFAVLRFKLKITDSIDAVAMSINTLIIAVYFYLGSIAGDPRPYFLVILHLLIFVIFWFLNENYKKFSWYRSGKIGFAGLLTIAVYFLIRSVIALYFPDVVSFVGKVDAMISAGVAFISFLGLYNLSRMTD